MKEGGWGWGEGGSNWPRQKIIPLKTPVLLGLIYLMGVLLNCKPSHEEWRASALRVYHIAISQRVSTCKPTGCEFTTASFDVRANEPESCKPVS